MFGARIVPSAPTEETSEDGSDSEAETEMEQNASHG
jgi:hypothetical protein